MAAAGRRSGGSLLLVAAAACVALRGLLTPVAFAQAGRREVLAAASAALLANPSLASAAVTPCKDGANNCFSTASKGKNELSAWKWPAGMSRDAAIKELRSVVEAYPKAGQDGVDQGGWSFAVDELDAKGYARLEFLSGIGNFARFFNGGKPFVDDFEISVEQDSVGIKSASRVGDSDLGVNAKRINFIAAGLRSKGWAAPGL
eukprot:TRINITY_DN53620_c0_g1_i1.p2 TRINITY_DN53620_c0_g1~~TRINITY_DN53620_c0_g1_i1.p2  ORF type:complete len:222 (+),score=56.85 TRINITY_DN53620_c0_g1_i1:58-666(+)